MRRVTLAKLVGMVLVLGYCGPLFAANKATANVKYTVGTIDEISVSGDPKTLAIASSKPGQAPDPVSDSSTTYAVTTNGKNRKITGSIDKKLPTGLTLSLELVAPTGGQSTGSIAMSTKDQNLVTGVSGVSESGMKITYTLAATLAAQPGSGTSVVTYTVSP
ncbi:MAG: hypothetical protein S4CHLAM81_15390 [Chlamydiales bacterium]|nr:hypothetical protein [Chlamydiales bacterium]MCH9636308.1 hypothetical protein [Chlamydiales bacterium]MCH9703973.1 hypothetical protein [Chlamydiota bacterium]